MPNIGTIWREQNTTKANTFSRGEIGTLFNFASTTVTVRSTQKQLVARSVIGSGGIYDNNKFGVYGLNEYANLATVTGAFVLGHTSFGILGTGNVLLGSGNMSEWEGTESTVTSKRITNVGRTGIRDWLAGSGNTAPTYMGIGSGNTAFAATQTELDAEISGNRANVSFSSTDKGISYNATWGVLTATGNTILEIGIFDATGNGNMFDRIVFEGGLNKTDLLQVMARDRIEFVNTLPMVDAGIIEIKDWLIGVSANAPTYMAWASGSTTPVETDTSIEGEVERNILTATGTSTDYRVDFESILEATQATANVAIRKTGVFNAASSGNMFTESTNPQIVKTNRFSIQTTHKISID